MATGREVGQGPYAALRLRDFRLLLMMVLTATVAVETQAVVVSWFLYALTRDPISLAAIGLAEALPYMGLALYAGHVADSHDRRRVAIVSLSTLTLASALLFVAIATPALARRSAASVGAVYALLAVAGASRSFLYAARSALAAELVPRALYGPAVTWMSSAWQTAAIAGPALGGLLYGVAGAGVAAGSTCALFGVALALLFAVRYGGAEKAPGEEAPKGVWSSVSEGLRFVRREPLLYSTMGLDLFAVFFGGVTALLPVYALDILRCGPEGLGLLRAAPAAGAILTALILAHRPPFRRAGPALLANVALFGVAITVFAVSRSYWLSLALLGLSGMTDEVSVIVRSTILQEVTPRQLLGRVNSVKAIFLGAANDLGAGESGVAARLLGTVPSVLAGSAMTLVAVGLTAWKVPSLRRLGRLDQLGGEPPEAALPAALAGSPQGL